MLVWRSDSLKIVRFLGCKMADAWDCPVRTKNLSTKKTRTKISICWCGGMADARDLKSRGSNTVWVRLPPPAPSAKTALLLVFAFLKSEKLRPNICFRLSRPIVNAPFARI